MDSDFKARYADEGRRLEILGLAVADLKLDELHAVIGFLFEAMGDDARADLRQAAPLGAPHSDPPKNDGLFEG